MCSSMYVADVADRARVAEAVEGEAGVRHRVAQRGAVRVTALGDVGEVLAGERAAAEQRSAEAGALLVHEAHEPDGTRRGGASRLEPSDRIEAGEHAERTVVASPTRHRVEVRADEHGAPRSCCPAPDDVACRVELPCEAQGAEPLREPPVRLHQLG